MQASISNVIDGLILKIQENLDTINSTIQKYQDNKQLTIFKGQRDNLGITAYPCVQLQPSSGTMNWNTTDSQVCQYSVDFYVTISTQVVNISVQYISALVRQLVQIFNMPYNMHFIIPNEKGYNPQTKQYTPLTIQFGNISSVSYVSNKVGTLRVAQFTWTGITRESYPREYWNHKKLNDLSFVPRIDPIDPLTSEE